MQKNNMEKSVHNQWLIEILSRIRYKLADSLDCYEFMKEDLYAEGKINQALGPLFTLNKEKVAQAFLMQVKILKKHAQTDNATNKISGSSQCNAYWMEGDKTYECGKIHFWRKN